MRQAHIELNTTRSLHKAVQLRVTLFGIVLSCNQHTVDQLLGS